MSLLERIRMKREFVAEQRRGVVEHDDPLLGWMTLATANLLHPGQVHLMAEAVRALPTDDPVVEIGSFCGYSTNVLSHLLRGRRNELVSTDPWIFEGEGGPTLPGADIAFTDYRALVLEQFERNVRFWSGDRLPHSFQLASDDFFAAWRDGAELVDVFGRSFALGGPISFCFIDGDHTYEQALRDFEHADAHVVPGGFILFDDSSRFGAFPQVFDVVQLAVRERGYELVGQNPHHLVRKRG